MLAESQASEMGVKPVPLLIVSTGMGFRRAEIVLLFSYMPM